LPRLLQEAADASQELYDQFFAAGRVDSTVKKYDKAIGAASEVLRLIPAGPEAEKLLNEARAEQSYVRHVSQGSPALSATRFADARQGVPDGASEQAE
jgi:hypothetical protein